ncbi:MAG: hypothetical protein ACRDR6_08045 [Pseudonocardiaceae bacterium]
MSSRLGEHEHDESDRDGQRPMIIIVYRGTAWVSIDSPFIPEATLEPMHIDSLMDSFTQAIKQARGDKKP